MKEDSAQSKRVHGYGLEDGSPSSPGTPWSDLTGGDILSDPKARMINQTFSKAFQTTARLATLHFSCRYANAGNKYYILSVILKCITSMLVVLIPLCILTILPDYTLYHPHSHFGAKINGEEDQVTTKIVMISHANIPTRTIRIK
jgi:hypothetical protein